MLNDRARQKVREAIAFLKHWHYFLTSANSFQIPLPLWKRLASCSIVATKAEAQTSTHLTMPIVTKRRRKSSCKDSSLKKRSLSTVDTLNVFIADMSILMFSFLFLDLFLMSIMSRHPWAFTVGGGIFIIFFNKK